MKTLSFLSILLIFSVVTTFSQSTITITKQRPAQLDLPAYKKIVIGDIVNATV